MTQTITNLEDLGELVKKKEPAEAVLDLRRGEERSGFLITYINGESRKSDRVTSDLMFRLYKKNGEIFMDITDYAQDPRSLTDHERNSRDLTDYIQNGVVSRDISDSTENAGRFPYIRELRLNGEVFYEKPEQYESGALIIGVNNDHKNNNHEMITISQYYRQ